MTKQNLEKMDFEAALSELEDVVNKLESGDMNLDNVIEEYTKGVNLKNHCEKRLKEAKLKVEKIISSKDGEIKTEDFE